MIDRDIVERFRVAAEVYKKENLIDADEHQVIDDFIEWCYRQYGIVYRKQNGNS